MDIPRLVQLSKAYTAHGTDPIAFCAALDDASKLLARSEELRAEIASVDNTDLWAAIEAAWKYLSQGTDADGIDGLDVAVCLSLSRFIRNIVAGVPTNQVHAFDLCKEPLPKIMFAVSSYMSLHDDLVLPTTRMLVQMLSNMVTANEALLSRFWTTNLEVDERRNLFIRLLQAEDERTLQGVLVLMNNALHESQSRRQLLTSTSVGKRVLVLLLDATQRLFDLEHPSQEPSTNGARDQPMSSSMRSSSGGAFDIAFALFSHQFYHGEATRMWDALRGQHELSQA